MASRTCERTPTWATVLLGWIVGAGLVEYRAAAWWRPSPPPVCSVESAGLPAPDGGLPRPPGPRELRRIAGVGQVRAVSLARYLLERSERRTGAVGLPTLAELTGIPGVGPVIGQRLHAHLSHRESHHGPPGPHRRRSRLSD